MNAQKITTLIFTTFLLLTTLLTSCGNDEFMPSDKSNTEDIKSSTDHVSDATTGESEKPNSSQSFRIDFVMDDGAPIKTVIVERGTNVFPPDPPSVAGSIFTGWEGEINDIQNDSIIVAKYINTTGKENLLFASTLSMDRASKGYVTIGISGNVCFCGLDIKVTFDRRKLNLLEITDTDDMVITNYNESSGVVFLNYTSTNNTTGELDLCKLVFDTQTEATYAIIQIEVTSIYYINSEDKLAIAKYQIQQGKINIFGGK